MQSHEVDIRVHLNKVFKVSLPITTGTGYKWQHEESNAFEFLGSITNLNSETPGAKATQILTFRAKSLGLFTMPFVLKRIWETSYEKRLEKTVSVIED